MHIRNSELAGGFSIYKPISVGTPTPEPTPIVAPIVAPVPALSYPAPQPKPAYIPPPAPIVAAVAPMPVVNIQQAAPVPRKAGLLASPWAIPAMIGGAGLLLVVALGKK